MSISFCPESLKGRISGTYNKSNVVLSVSIKTFSSDMQQSYHLVGDKLSPNNPGGGVEGELHSNWGQLQLLDGVRLEKRMIPVNMASKGEQIE